MSWCPATPIVARAASLVAVSLIKLRGGPIRLSILLREPVIKKLGAPKTVGVMFGHGEHDGRLKIAADGAFALIRFEKGGGRVLLARPSHLPDMPCKAIGCESAFEGSALIVTLPDWPARASAPAAAAPKSIPAGVFVNTASRAVDRTAELMGDPPRGRSALDASARRR